MRREGPPTHNDASLTPNREAGTSTRPADTSPTSSHGAVRIVAGIPCHNEARFIAGVIGHTQRFVNQVIVVDDGSSDDTAAVAASAGAHVVRHPTNRGYGQAIMSLFEAARQLDADVLVTLDGDGQHDPEDLLEVLEPVIAGRADLVIGSRFLGKPNNVPRYRKFGIDVITLLYNLGAHPWITDAQSGFRAYRRELLERLTFTDRGMGLSVETLIKARRAGFRLHEVPIACRYHDAGSSINPVRHGVGVALKVVEHRVRGAIARDREAPARGR